jgi:hypothetical protein
MQTQRILPGKRQLDAGKRPLERAARRPGSDPKRAPTDDRFVVAGHARFADRFRYHIGGAIDIPNLANCLFFSRC